MFSGSYCADDVAFLLKVIEMPPHDICEKERLIQSGKRHYSEMIGMEHPPTSRYLALFREACMRNNPRFALDLARLSRHISDTVQGEITIVSLARAGTPIGVILTRVLRSFLKRKVCHYSISIIRDRGIDEVALRHILEVDRRPPEGIVFVDGWTGKGVIARELSSAIQSFNARTGHRLSASLHVVADLSGSAEVAVTSDDYLIPPSILNSVVSGLISRSILNSEYIGPGDFHGCIYYREFAHHDFSSAFVDMVMKELCRLPASAWTEPCAPLSLFKRRRLQAVWANFIDQVRKYFNTTTIHHVKPGIGEATRVLLRRVPRCVMVRNRNDDDVAHLVHLAEEKQVPLIEESSLPYRAAALIKSIDE